MMKKRALDTNGINKYNFQLCHTLVTNLIQIIISGV
jgi:hypothetical protein